MWIAYIVNNDKIFVFLSISYKNLWLSDKIDLRYIFDLLFYVGHHRESSFEAKIKANIDLGHVNLGKFDHIISDHIKRLPLYFDF